MKIIDKTTIKFLLVGVVNTLVGTSIMFLFYNVFHLGYWFSSASNYVAGSIVSYLLNKFFTFKNNEKSLKSIFRFVVNISVCYLVAYGVAKPVVHWMFGFLSASLRDNVAMLAGMGIFVVLNYLGQRFFVFKSGGQEEERTIKNGKGN